MKKISLFSLLMFFAFSASISNLNPNQNTKIILPTDNITLQDLNPLITEINDAYFLIANAIKNTNLEKTTSLLSSSEIKKIFTHQQTIEENNLKKQNTVDISQIDQANAHKRTKLRELLTLIVSENSSSQHLEYVTELFSENKKINEKDKFELYKDAQTIYKATKKVLAIAKEHYLNFLKIYDKDLPSKVTEQLKQSLETKIKTCLEMLGILVKTFAEKGYTSICYESQNFDSTIWSLYKHAKQFHEDIRNINNSQTDTKDFVKIVGPFVENEYNSMKEYSDSADAAIELAAKGFVSASAAGIIALTIYLNNFLNIS